MIHIKSVHVEGYKSILDAEVKFLPGLNVIIGKNGAGKSNLLAAVEGLLLGKARTILSANVEVKIGLPDGEITRFKYSATERKSTLEQSPLLLFANSSEHIQSMWAEVGTSEQLREISELITITHTLPNDILFLDRRFTFKVGPEQRDLHDLLQAMTDPSTPFFCRAVVAKIYHSMANAFEGMLPDWDKATSDLRAIIGSTLGLYDTSMAFLTDFTPVDDVRLAEDCSIVPKEGERIIQVNNMSYEFKIGGNWHAFEELSDGTQRMIYVILSLCMPRMYLPLENSDAFFIEEHVTNRLVLLEEPELGIHPHQLHQILQFLKAQGRKHQIIITTHSPQVLDILGRDDLDRIIIASYDAKKGSKFDHLNEQQRSKAQAYLKDMLLSDFWRFSNLEPRTNE